MALELDNWRTQVRKGYLELCLLLMIRLHKRIYGFDLIEKLKAIDLPVKEGTLYPMLNRMTEDKVLSATWDTENVKGHPRKFYSLTKDGQALLLAMQKEFKNMVQLFEQLDKQED